MFVLAYRDCVGTDRVTVDSHRRYFLPRIKIGNYNIEIHGRNCYDQPINDLIKADLSKQKVLDAYSRAIQQIIFTGKANAGAMIYYILE